MRRHVAPPGLLSDIAGAHYPEQVLDNALAAKIQLSAAQLAEIDTIVTDHLGDSQIMWNW